MNLLALLYSFWGWISGKSRFNAQVEALFAGFDYDAEVARTEALLAVFQPEAEAQKIKSVTRELVPSEYLCPRQTCQGVMIKRRGRYGSFYGCSEYPLCGSTAKRIGPAGGGLDIEHRRAKAAGEESLYTLVGKFGRQEGRRRWDRVLDKRKRRHKVQQRLAKRIAGLERLMGPLDQSTQR